MRFDPFSFGSIRIEGTALEYDVVIDLGEVRKRKKGPSKQFSDAFGHGGKNTLEMPPTRHRYWAYGRLTNRRSLGGVEAGLGQV